MTHQGDQEPQGWVGRGVKRGEDLPLITGRGQYLEDLQIEGMCDVVLLRSDYAHARIRGSDVRQSAGQRLCHADPETPYQSDELAGGISAHSNGRVLDAEMPRLRARNDTCAGSRSRRGVGRIS